MLNTCLKHFSKVSSSISHHPSYFQHHTLIKQNPILRLINSRMSSIGRQDRGELIKLSKEDLIQLVLDLQSKDINLETSQVNLTEAKKRKLDGEEKKNKKKDKNKEKKPFDMSKYAQRQVALKVAYIGWNYMGLASQGDASTALPLEKINDKEGLKIDNPDNPKQKIVATVEDYIYKALLSCKLILDPKDCNFSRCGRTDKGVSGLKQVISIKLRSGVSKETLEKDPFEVEGELPYTDMINKSLPEDIRVLAWAPVKEDFNARFDCRSRSYKYFFTTSGTNLNIDLMRKACTYLVGTHDFRNFCRQDGSKQISVFIRDIFEAKIQKADLWFPENNKEMSSPFCYELYIKGSGFLWNQIRCIMSILFLIGQGLEKPEVITEFLNAEKLNQKPVYELSAPYPLLFFDCDYETEIKWQLDTKNEISAMARSYRTIYTKWYECVTKAYHFSNVIKELEKLAPEGLESFAKVDPSLTPIVIGAGQRSSTRNYIHLLQRNRASSVEVRNQRYRDKVLRKQGQQSEESENSRVVKL